MILVWGHWGEKVFNSFGNYFGFGALEEKAFNSFGGDFGLGALGYASSL